MSFLLISFNQIHSKRQEVGRSKSSKRKHWIYGIKCRKIIVATSYIKDYQCDKSKP